MIGRHRIRPATLALAIGLASPVLLAAGSLVEARSSDLWDDMAICFAGAAGTSPGAVAGARRAEARRFMAENEAAMKRMMAAMTIAPTGDIDGDFVTMMVAHHQGAIDMAIAELQHGGNEQLRRIAQEIVVTQQQEIRAMRQAIGPASERQAAAARPVSNHAQ